MSSSVSAINSWINTPEKIEQYIKRGTDGFSFVDLLASFIGNSQFKEGYTDLKRGADSDKKYLWEALSAIGQDVGDTIYQNVTNYIENASDIDTCKIKALQSMMKMFGMEYQVLAQYDNMPVEIQNIINVMSINRKYLSKYGFLDSMAYGNLKSNVTSELSNISEDDYSDKETEGIIDQYRNTHHSITFYTVDEEISPLFSTYVLSIDNGYDVVETLDDNNVQISAFIDDSIPIIVNRVYFDQNINDTISDAIDQNLDTINGFAFLKFNIHKSIDQNCQKFYGLFSYTAETNAISNGITWDNFLFKNKTDPTIKLNKLLVLIPGFESLVNYVNGDDITYDEFFSTLGSSSDDLYDLKKSIEQFSNNDEDYLIELRAQVLASVTDYDFIKRTINSKEHLYRIVYNNLGGLEYDRSWFDDAKYKQYLTELYQNLLSGMCNLYYLPRTDEARYDSVTSAYYRLPIYNFISSDLTQNALYFETESQSKYDKTLYNIELSFNEIEIVNNIEQGLDSLDNYDGAKLTILEDEIERRKQPLDADQTNYRSRTSYYREEKVKEYFTFVQNEFYGKHIETKSDRYNLDANYIEIDTYKSKYKYLITENSDGEIEFNKDGMIEYIAKDLADTTMYIQRLRNKLKIQGQKYYMKGTFNLVSFTINEYLMEFARLNTELNDSDEDLSEEVRNVLTKVHDKLLNHKFSDIEVVEYDDLTEYYNIEGSNSTGEKSVNPRYWETEVDSTGYKLAIASDVISNFYINTLKSNSVHKTSIKTESDVDKFLAAIYNVGANQDKIKSNGNIQLQADADTEDFENHKKMFLTFTGTKYGYYPYYNIKNSVHPSYQIHPYLKQFVEATNSAYTIKNSFENGIARDIIYKSGLEKMKEHVGKFGETINMFNDAIDFTGYQDYYESNQQTEESNSGSTSPVIGYSGAFYPPALEEYLSDSNSFINDVSNRNLDTSSAYYKYYKHLNLSDLDLVYTVNQLKSYYNEIKDLTSPKSQKTDVYNIYKFGTDKYENQYILYKKYNSNKPTYSEKENTVGRLWIKLKNHPFAFPAFLGEYPIISLEKDKVNGKLLKNYGIDLSSIPNEDIYQIGTEENSYKNADYDIIYDIEFDLAKRTVFIVTTERGQYKNEFKYGDVLICNLSSDIDPYTNKTSLYFTDDVEIKYDSFDTGSLSNIVNQFVGFYKDATKTGAVYIQREYSNNNLTIDQSKLSVLLSFYCYHDNELTELYNTVVDIAKLDDSKLSGKYNICDDIVRFNHNGDNFVFAFLTEQTNLSSTFKSYVGETSQLNGEFTYPNDCNGYVAQLSSVYETNSLDQLDKFVTILNGKLLTNNQINFTDINLYNTNSDASYIPVYPGDKGKSENWKTKKYENSISSSYQLLGQSKNINNLINSLQTETSILDDIDDISAQICGRVYEDFNPQTINLIQTIKNPTIYSESGDDTGSYLNWSYSLSGYELTSIPYLQIILLNSNNTKSAYHIGNIQSIINAENQELNADGYINGDNDEDIQTKISDYNIKIGGTFNIFESAVNLTDSNHLTNISSIKLNYSNKDNTLNIKFYKTNEEQQTYIEQDEITLIIYDSANMYVYNFYHYLDEQGIVKYEKSPIDADENSIQEVLDSRYILVEIPAADIAESYYNTIKEKAEKAAKAAVGTLQEGDIDTVSTIGDVIDELAGYSSSTKKVYLSSIQTLEDITALSDCQLLSGYFDLTFKYSEEEVFRGSHQNYYYPGRNVAYPILKTSAFGGETSSINVKNIFGDKNMFIIQPENGKTFADKIGNVSIPVQWNDTDSIRAFEDYDESVQLEDPSVVSSLHFYVDDESVDLTNDFKEIKLENNLGTGLYIPDFKFNLLNSTDTVLTEIENYFKLYHFNDEELSSDAELDSIETTINSSNTDLGDLLNIYISWQWEKDGTITLFFNYYNYINTPYILFDEETGTNNPDLIEGSYLKLKAGEEGVLDIDVQIKSYFGKTISGYRSAKLVSYKVYNVSDDKPKFVLYKINEIQKDSLSNLTNTGLLTVRAINSTIDLDDDNIDLSSTLSSNISINIDSSVPIKKEMMFNIKYDPTQITFNFNSSDTTTKIYKTDIFKIDYSVNGLLQVTTTETVKSREFVLSAVTKQTKQYIIKNKINEYKIAIKNINNVVPTKGSIPEIIAKDGTIIFGYKVLLRPENETDITIGNVTVKGRDSLVTTGYQINKANEAHILMNF